jgi:hypothetical protein
MICNRPNDSYVVRLVESYKEFNGYELCPKCDMELNAFMRQDPDFPEHLYDMFNLWLITKNPNLK